MVFKYSINFMADEQFLKIILGCVVLLQVEHLKNVASCGNVKLAAFKAWALEMQVEESEIAAVYDERQVLYYITLLCVEIC